MVRIHRGPAAVIGDGVGTSFPAWVSKWGKEDCPLEASAFGKEPIDRMIREPEDLPGRFLSYLVRSSEAKMTGKQTFLICHSARRCGGAEPTGFTLIELLVVVAIVAVLIAVLFPVLMFARAASARSSCAAQLKQLGAAMLMYADDQSGRFCPAASDIIPPGANLHRWHGTRDRVDRPFDFRRSPIYPYLSRSGGLKRCPLTGELWKQDRSPNAFEAECGGYGYNQYYVGGTYYRNTGARAAEEASQLSDIRRPGETVMFTDAAMALTYPQPHLIEYSFCEPPYLIWMEASGQMKRMRGSPSIHFRHGTANVVWCDGHVSSPRMSFTTPFNAYGADNRAARLGWFGPDDNTLFDNN